MENWILSDETTTQDGVIVKCVAEIRDNETGKVRDYETDEIIFNGCEYPYIFNWEENNFSCDCNRRIFFKRVMGENEDSDFNQPCGSGKFSVNLKNKKDNKIYYCEFEN